MSLSSSESSNHNFATVHEIYSDTSNQSLSENESHTYAETMNQTFVTVSLSSSESSNHNFSTVYQISSDTSNHSLSENESHTYPETMNQTLATVSRSSSETIKQEENLGLPCSKDNPNWVSTFCNLEDMSQTMLQALDAAMIVLSTDGVIYFVTENITTLLGYLSYEVMGRKLLGFLPDEEKNEVYQKISMKTPVSDSVGAHIDFCCHLKRGNTKPGVSPTYELVKFILTLRDICSKSFVFFGGFAPNCFCFESAATKFPAEDRFLLVGSVCVINTVILKELCSANQLHENSINHESDEEDSLGIHRYLQGKISGINPAAAAFFDDQVAQEKDEPEEFRPGDFDDCSSSVTSISSSEVIPESLTTTFHAFALESMMDPKRCQDPVDIEFPVDCSSLEEYQDSMKWEIPTVPEVLMTTVKQDILEDPETQEVLIKPVVQEDLPSSRIVTSHSAQVQQTASRHIINSPDSWVVEETPRKQSHKKVKCFPSDGRESKRFCTHPQLGAFTQGLENSSNTSTQYLQELRLQMQQKEELQMQQMENPKMQQKKKPKNKQWEELQMQLKEEPQMQQKEEPQMQPQILQKQLPDNQKRRKKQLKKQGEFRGSTLHMRPERFFGGNEDKDSENRGSESPSICLVEQQGAALAHSSKSVSIHRLLQSPDRPLPDFNTEDIIQVWLEPPESQGDFVEFDSWNASDSSSSQEQDSQKQVEAQEAQASATVGPERRRFIPVGEYNWDYLLRQQNHRPQP
ncbi:PREDICTED: PAS domain-containing protein 1 [Chinchilla lanigera]|uniref:PAS domain-containing protein 1 n=1 Tax=Chinchilla lanigera TaxID=34839 RepID=UPI000697AD96|nr:PREDICTED: PAS domain-containing protein 1 [Chinchilla lanigera]